MADLGKPGDALPQLSPEAGHCDLYGASYYEGYQSLRTGSATGPTALAYRWGEPYWEAFFARIAKEIVDRLNPHNVLDAGCAMGFLVKALRDRGALAEGFDTSTWAIAQVPVELRQFCHVGSVTDELSRDFDLITCIEVLEHVSSKDAGIAIGNFCEHARSVLFSSTPEHFDELTHINVRSPDYWAGKFCEHGFFRDFDFDASFVAPHAVLYRPVQHLSQVVRGYERWSWEAQRELHGVRAHRDQLHSEVIGARQELAALMSTKTFRLSGGLRSIWARMGGRLRAARHR